MAIKLFGFTFKQSQKIIVKRREDQNEYVSSLENVNPQGIQIAHPLKNLKPIPLLKEEKIRVCISLPSSSLEFDTFVKGFRRDNIPMVILEFPEDFKRIQRRSTVRLKVLLDVEVALLPGEPGQAPVFVKGQGVDISAGGMEIFTRLAVGKDQEVLVKFCLELDSRRKYDFCIKSKVRRVAEVTKRSRRLGVEFLEMSTTNSDRIFQYIFKKSTTSIN